MKYKVNPYLIYSLNSEETTIVQTRDNSFATKNELLVNFLNYLEQNGIDIITAEDFIRIFGNKDLATESIQFLLEASILKDYKERYLSDKNDIHIFSNSNQFLSLSKFFWGTKIEVHQEIEFKPSEIENSLVVICLDPFSLKKLKELLKKISRDSSNVYKVVFPYNHSLYVSNYYSPVWGNPCPLCFFYSIESQLRGNQTGRDNMNFQVMVDLFYKEKGSFEYDGLLKKEDWISVINQLNKDFKINDDTIAMVDDVLKIDLRDYSLSYDTCYFWEMCDCYE